MSIKKGLQLNISDRRMTVRSMRKLGQAHPGLIEGGSATTYPLISKIIHESTLVTVIGTKAIRTLPTILIMISRNLSKTSSHTPRRSIVSIVPLHGPE